jgi:hypothetical protein
MASLLQGFLVTKYLGASRNTAKSMLPKPNTNTPIIMDTTRTTQTCTHATEVLQLSDPIYLEDIPSLCHRAIAVIINKANRKLADSLRKKEDQLYKKSPKRYHNNLKTAARLQPNAKDQLKFEANRDPNTNNIITSPPQIIDPNLCLSLSHALTLSLFLNVYLNLYLALAL